MNTTAGVQSDTKGRSAILKATRWFASSIPWGLRPHLAEEQEGRRTEAFAAGLCIPASALLWLGYVPTREWRSGTEPLRERRAAEGLVLSDAALSPDMKGAWASLIVPINPIAL